MSKRVHTSNHTRSERTRTHHKPTAHPTGKHTHIRTRWAVLIMACWLAVGLLIGVALLQISRHRGQTAVTVKVLKTTYDRTGQEPFAPGTDYKFVLVDVSIVNGTTETFNLAPVVQSYLTDTKGDRYEMAPAIIAQPLAAGRLADNVHTVGTLSYVVPQDATDLTFHFEADSPQHVRYQYRLPAESP